MKKKKKLDIYDLLEDLAYEQAHREWSGQDWFCEFIDKLDKVRGAK